jgi:hypothetical protein
VSIVDHASAVVRFYRGQGRDQSGRTLDEIVQWDDGALEDVHDFIQWLFPLNEASGANWNAPILTPDDIQAFHRDDALRGALWRSLIRMLAFYGFELRGDGESVSIGRGPGWAARSRNWLTPVNHNHLRLTRIMKSLSLLGIPELARALQAALLTEAAAAGTSVISSTTVRYWKSAVESD